MHLIMKISTIITMLTKNNNNDNNYNFNNNNNVQ